MHEVFDSMPPRDGGVGYGTIFELARKAGYTGPPARPSGKEVFKDVPALKEANTVPDEVTPRHKFTPADLTCKVQHFGCIAGKRTFAVRKRF